MIADLKPYPEYKESGLPWLDAMPSHWTTTRNGNLFQQRNETRRPELPILEVSLKTGVRVRNFGSSKRKQVMADASKYKRADAGDITYNMMRMWQGAVGVAPVEGLVSPAYVVARPFSGTHSSYYVTLFKNGFYMGEIDAASRGIVKDRNRLYWEQFKQMRSLAPPPAEQAAIVRFLDHWNGRLEKAIRSKRRVIALLQEQKQAIIHRAVTKGLDPKVKLKDSGIPWLGEIPAHWEMRRLKSLTRFVTSGSRGWGAYYSDSGSVFLRIGNISTTSIDLRLDRISYVKPPRNAEGERTRAKEGDILLSITAQIGAVGVVPSQFGEAFVNQHTALIRLRPDEAFPRWVAYVLLSRFGKQQCQLLTNGGTKIGLTLDDVRCLSILCPPMHEQETILQVIEEETLSITNAITRYEREITLLREYRTRLTADVVTGKLDVRAAAAQLPDPEGEPAEAEAQEMEEETEMEEELA